jgi:Lon protease-like protein
MPKKDSTPDTEIQELLIEALEVQLVTFKSGIEFWTAWTEHATKFSEDAMKRLAELKSDSPGSSQILLEATDISKEALRAMTSLPHRTAESFIEQLDAMEAARKLAKKSRAKPKPKRSVRAKP